MPELIIKQAENEAEYLAGRELASRVFTRGGQLDPHIWEERARRFLSQPGYDVRWHYLGLVDGKVVGHVVAKPYTLRYGSVELRVGGVGAVCTDEAYRQRGVAAAVMQASIAYMQARGDHISLLRAGPVYYERFGYHTVWPEYTLTFQAADAAGLRASLPVRPVTADDLPQIAALYDRQWGQRVTMPRGLGLWRWRFETFPPDSFHMVEDSSGHVVGYAAGFWKGYEVVAETAAAALSLAVHCGGEMLHKEQAEVDWGVPPDDRVVYDLRRWIPSTHKAHFYTGAHWMARIVDADELRETLLPEINAQAGIDLRGLIFDIQPDAVYIGLRGQDSTNVQLEHGVFLQVLFGSLPPHMLDVHPDAAHLLGRLFPPRVAMIAPWDYF